MTTEQREAVDRLEKRIKDNKDYKTTQVWLTDDVVATQIVLSLIKEQQIYIKKYNDTTEEMNRDIRKLISEIQKKDKQIDLMAEIFYKRFKAELLLEYGFESEEQLKQYFERISRKGELKMLKIKDNVDIKELEKFGFKKNEYTHLLVLRKEEHDFACIDIRNKNYEIIDLCNLTYNLTYDLIRAGLVEKE